MPRGGAREGAGRKPKAETYARQIAATEKRIAASMAALLVSLEQLADGGAEREMRVEQPAGTLFRDVWIQDEDEAGEPVGKARRDKVLIFPELPPLEMVCIKRVITVEPGDRQAIIYLLDRIMGKPAGEDQSDQYEAVFEEIRSRLVAALDGLDAETREQIKAALRTG